MALGSIGLRVIVVGFRDFVLRFAQELGATAS